MRHPAPPKSVNHHVPWLFPYKNGTPGAGEATLRLSKAFSLSPHDAVASTCSDLHMRNNRKGSKRHRNQSTSKDFKRKQKASANDHTDYTGFSLLPSSASPECSHQQRSCKWNIGQDASACLQSQWVASPIPINSNQLNKSKKAIGWQI